MLQLSDVQALLEQAEKDREKGHDAVEAEYKAAIGAIEKVQELVSRRNPFALLEPIPKELIEDNAAVVSKIEWPGLRGAIREAIDVHPRQFTLDDVVHYLNIHYRHTAKRVTVSGELWRMNRGREIDILIKGAGSKPNVYTKMNGHHK